MHNNQPDTRKRIALLIVISILSLIAAPLVPRFNTNTKAAQLPSPPYIPTFIRRVNLQANNLVYSEATQALYASVQSREGGLRGNSITRITPETGEVGPSVFIGSEPDRMAISGDGRTIWTHLNGVNAVRRFDVVTQTAGLQFSTGSITPQPPLDMVQELDLYLTELAQVGGNLTKAARRLGINRSTLHMRIKRLEMKLLPQSE